MNLYLDSLPDGCRFSPKGVPAVSPCYGGKEPRRESLKSGTDSSQSLLAAGVDAFSIDVGRPATLVGKIDDAFIDLHGRMAAGCWQRGLVRRAFHRQRHLASMAMDKTADQGGLSASACRPGLQGAGQQRMTRKRNGFPADRREWLTRHRHGQRSAGNSDRGVA